MLAFWKKSARSSPPLVALSADVPPVHTLFLALGEGKAREVLQRGVQRLAHLAAAQGGMVMRADSTSLLALFEQAEAALRCARALRRDLALWVRPIAQEVDVHVDIGLSWGLVHGHPPDYEGPTLTQAQTLAAAAEGGQILLDAALVQQLPVALRQSLQPVHRVDPEFGLTEAWLDLTADDARATDPLWLHLQPAKGGAEQIVTPGEVIRIGRAPSTEVRIDREGVSRQHAVILWRDGDYTLTDLSRNGTWLQYGLSGVVVRVARSAAVLRAAGALYFGRAPQAGQPPDVRFLVERPRAAASERWRE
jgi:hypothetical protein